MSSKSIVPISQYPTVNEYGIIVLLGHVWVYVGKRKGFRRGRRRDLVVNGELGWWKRLLQTEGEEDHRARDGHGGCNRHPLRAYHGTHGGDFDDERKKKIERFSVLTQHKWRVRNFI